MTTPIRTYNEYDQQYVQPAAASLEALMQRFAVELPRGASAFSSRTELARPSWTTPFLQPPLRPQVETAPVQSARPSVSTGMPGEPTRTRGYFGQTSVFGRFAQGQVGVEQMSDIDLQQEGKALGLQGFDRMPRVALERAVQTLRKSQQQRNEPGLMKSEALQLAGTGIGMLESLQNTAEAVAERLPEGVAIGLEMANPAARAWLSTIFNSERNRAVLGQIKANLRLSATEQQAATMDKAEAFGEFVGPMLPQGALWSAIKATGKVAAAAPVVGKAASWLFNGGLRGDVISGALTGLVWNAQYEMPWLPKSEDLDDLIGGESLGERAQGAIGTLNSRLGGVMFDIGLGAFLGRLGTRGATALPDEGRPVVVPALTGPISDGPLPMGAGGPAGLLDNPMTRWTSEPGSITPPAPRPQTLLPAPVFDDQLGWKPGPPSTPTDVVLDNMPVVRSEGPSAPSAGPSNPTAEVLAAQYLQGETTWPTKVPLPPVEQNNVPNWQNLESARLARLQGTVLTREDGSLIALVHEGPAFDESFTLQGPGRSLLTGRGVYFRDRMDEAYAAYSQEAGYGARTVMQNSEKYKRTAEMLETVENQIDQLSVALEKAKGKQKAQILTQIADLGEQVDTYSAALNEMGTPTAASHPVFAVVKKPFYFDSPISKDKAEEILRVVETNPQFESVRPSLTQLRKNFDDLWQPDQPEPLASQFHAVLSDLWQNTPEGPVTLRWSGDTNRLLMAAGYDAIHNIGGVRAGATAKMVYNAWNLLDPENQVIRVFDPPMMDAGNAELVATQLSKQAKVIESPAVESLVGKATVVDADIISAEIAKNPFGVQVVRGVKDLGPMMQKIQMGKVGVDGVLPTSYRVVPKDLVPGGTQTFDVMVSTGKDITDGMVSDYKKYGVFEGMHGVTGQHSRPVEVVKVFEGDGVSKVNGRVSVKGQAYVSARDLELPSIAKQGKIRSRIYTSRLETFLESRGSSSIIFAQDPSIQQLSGEFLDYAMGRLGTNPEGLLTMDSLAKLGPMLNEFSVNRGVPPAARSVMGDLIEAELHAMAKSMVGEDLQAVNTAVREALDSVVDESAETLQQLGLRRGLKMYRGDAGSWTVEGKNGSKWHFVDDAAAQSFVRSYQVDVEDLSPSGPVFPEVADALEPDVVIRPEPDLNTQQQAAVSSMQTLQRFAGQKGGGAGAAPPPPPPRTPAPPATAGGGQPPRPGFNPTTLAHNIARIQHDLDSFVWQNVMPSRAFFDQMDALLEEVGAGVLHPGQDAFNLRLQMSKFYNDSADLLGALTTDMNQFRSKMVRSGKVWEALTYPVDGVPATQTAPARPPRGQWMQAQGFTRREALAVDQLSTLFEAIHGQGTPHWDMLKLYVRAVEVNMAKGLPDPYAMPPQLAQYLRPIQPFMDHAKKRGLRLETPDAGMILHEYIRSHYWAQDVKPTWDVTASKWRQLQNWQDFRGERPLAPLANYVLGWMDGIEHGFLPQSDPILNGVQWVLEKFGAPLTKSETMGLIGGTMSSAYRALLGWNPYAIMRDMTQPLLATPWTTTKHLGQAYLAVAGAKGQKAQKAAWQAAIDGGWFEKGIPPVLASNLDQSAINPRVPTGAPQFSPTQEKVRAFAQQVGDMMRDMLPPALRSIEGTKIDPLWAYTQQGIVSRVIVGNAAASRFDEVVGQPGTVQTTLRALGAESFSRAQARHVEELLQTGDVTAARVVYANTVADMVMNRYGVKEGAVGNHRVLGRVGTQLGGHSSHQLSMFYNLAKGGKGSPALYRMMATIGAMTGAYVYLEKETGWQFTKYNPLNWAQSPQLGGPLIEPAGRALEAGAAAVSEGVRAVTGGESSEFETRRIEEFLNRAPKDVSRLAGTPAAGFRFVTGLGGALNDSPEAVGRYLFTGDRRGDNQYDMVRAQQNLYDYLNGGYRETKGGGAQ